MKKAYTSPKAKIEYAADIVSTSAEVETGKIPFLGFIRSLDLGPGEMDPSRDPAYNKS